MMRVPSLSLSGLGGRGGGLAGISMDRATREQQQAEEAGTEYQPWANIINPTEQAYYRRMGRQASAPGAISIEQLAQLEEANPEFVSGGWGAFGATPKKRATRDAGTMGNPMTGTFNETPGVSPTLAGFQNRYNDLNALHTNFAAGAQQDARRRRS